MPRRFYQRNNFEGSLFSFTKSAVLSHFKIGGFVSFQNRRFCLNFKIGGFVSFSKPAVLSHLKSAVLSCPPFDYLLFHCVDIFFRLLENVDNSCSVILPRVPRVIPFAWEFITYPVYKSKMKCFRSKTT